MEKLVTIIIPIYNVEDYLVDCINSVKAQIYQNLEVICVDDCSTDNSYSVVKNLTANDSRFSLVRNEENRGQSYSRNVGMKIAKGEYILFLDSDDVLSKQAIKVLMQYAEEGNYDSIFYSAQRMDVFGENIIANICHRYDKEFICGIDCFDYLVGHKEYIASACLKFCRKDFLCGKGIYFYDGIVHEDTLFAINLMLNADKIRIVPDVLYYYRNRPCSTSYLPGKRQLRSCVVVYAELLRLLAEHALIEKVSSGLIWRIQYFENKIANIFWSEKEVPLIKFDNPYYSTVYGLLRQVQPSPYRYIRHIANDDKANWLDKKIYIYGAGKIAKEVVAELECNNINIQGLIVSGRDVTSLGKYSVQCVDDVNLCKSKDLVILGLSRNFHREIMDKLSRCGVEVYDILLG